MSFHTSLIGAVQFPLQPLLSILKVTKYSVYGSDYIVDIDGQNIIIPCITIRQKSHYDHRFLPWRSRNKAPR